MLSGPGLGFRRELSQEMLEDPNPPAKFVEFAPENWVGLGGKWGRTIQEVVERYPVLCHGLSLSLGSPEPIDWEFLKSVKQFLNQIGARLYSEHLSFSKCDNAHMHDLLPIPFREDAVHHVAQRIREVQEFLERRIAIENVSYYTSVAPEMDEATFIRSIVEEADCDLLLDVNNVYVNAFNHRYDAKSFIEKMPLDRVAYIHMAGHEQESETLIIDTHGNPIIDPVYELFEWTTRRIQPVPVLLERDFNTNYPELCGELIHLQEIMDRNWAASYAS